MELELYPLLSTVILVTTVVTIVFALFSYLAYRTREKRRPVIAAPASQQLTAPRPPLFRRYQPNS